MKFPHYDIYAFHEIHKKSTTPISGADKTNHWELSLMSQHFHPSVELFANTVLEGKDIKYTGDPLQDFTLMR